MAVFLKVFISLALGLAASTAFAGGADIRVSNPWVRAAPPNAKVLAAYLEIRNDGEKPQTLVKVSSPAFGQAGIHRSVMHGNMSHMEHLKELDIPAKTSVALKPGGLHLMLMEAKKPLRTGDRVRVTLAFKSGEKITLDAPVRDAPTEEAGDRGHADHGGHGKHDH